MLAKAVGFTLALSGIGALILYFFPEFVMINVFGPHYLAAVPIVTIFGVVMLPMSLTMVLMNYLLAQGRTGFVYFMAVAATFEVAGIHFFNENLCNVLYVIVVAGFMALGPIALYMIRSRA